MSPTLRFIPAMYAAALVGRKTQTRRVITQQPSEGCGLQPGPCEITQKYQSYSLGYLLALLNSRLYFQWLFHRGKRKGKMLEMMQIPLSEIPIKKIDPTEQKKFVDLTDLILASKRRDANADTSNLEQNIDTMIFDLFGLNSEERELVMDSTE